jgi:ABC-2 type transport system permease protein
MYREFAALTRREFLKIARNPQALVTSLLLPILYLILFGQGFNLSPTAFQPNASPAQIAAFNAAYFRGAPNYYSYFAVGMVGFTAVTATLFIGANVIFDKLFGVFRRVRGSPAPSASVFGARLVAGSAQPVALALMVVGLALLFAHIPGLNGLEVTNSISAVSILEVLLAIVLLSTMFATMFLTLGIVLDVPQTYFAAVNAFNLPVLLTSDALYPWGSMPEWLRNVSSYNPVSLAVNTMRENLFGSAAYPYPPEVYLLGLLVWTATLFTIAILLARRALRPLE